MIPRVRVILAIGTFLLGTIPLVLWQTIAMRTGWMNERRALRAWHRMILFLIGMKVHVTGEMSQARPLLLVSSHVSWTDAMVFGAHHDIRFVIKSEVSGWPGIGFLAKLQRPIFVQRAERHRSGEQANALAQALADGEAMVLFAEGTTSDGNTVLPFKTTLFAALELALREGVVDRAFVQPVALVYTRRNNMPLGRQHRPHVAWIGGMALLPHLTALLQAGSYDAELHFLPPIECRRGMDRKAVARQAEAAVKAAFGKALRDPR